VRVLLFQARDADDAMRGHEERCFRDKLSRFEESASPLELNCLNLVTESLQAQASWREHDVVLVGGSGSYGAVANLTPWFGTFLDTLRQIVEDGKPMLCSCFGHQALAVALGGQVITDRANAELGTHEVSLTEAGLEDPLFHGFPTRFLAQFGHNDRVSQLPAGAVHLASTGRCPIQSYRLEGRMVYATQFHPEMSHAENQERAMGYLQVYDVEQTTAERLANMFRPSPEASDLVARFLCLVWRSRQA
jgi:GMP synthase (glutamine-hydrolysing)